LSEIDVIYQFLDEGQAAINMILGNRFVKSMRTEADNFRKSLLTLSNAVEEWIKVQQAWMYLENIFQSADIKKQLGSTVSKFEAVDKYFKALMIKTQKSSNCIKIVKTTYQLVEQLKVQNETLDKITMELQKYMETKRQTFPRFYFLSDDELLEILANSDNKDVIMLHLKTLFDNLVKLDIVETEILKMHSREKEVIEFTKCVKMRAPVEGWLLAVEAEMRVTIQRRMKEGNKNYTEAGRKQWCCENPGQVVATIAQVQWCTGTEDALNEMQNDRSSLQTWKDQNDVQLRSLTELVRSNLTDLERCIIVALITTDVHARDIVEELRRDNVSSVYDFNWQK
jgi:dynein heavy chain, axonemal